MPEIIPAGLIVLGAVVAVDETTTVDSLSNPVRPVR
jgi:hypothetical protein